MLCQECNQRPATLHFTKIVNGKKHEFHICEYCAREKGEYIPGSNSFSIHQLLSGLLNFEQPITQGVREPQDERICSKCEMTFEQFVRTGRFGCAHCYETFNDKIDPILKRVHSGNTQHTGKIPKRIGGSIHLRRKIFTLKEQLQRLIVREEFEEAAKVRDEIRMIEKYLESQGEG